MAIEVVVRRDTLALTRVGYCSMAAPFRGPSPESSHDIGFQTG